MSTRASIFYLQHDKKGDHKLNIHIYQDMHESPHTVMVDFSCSTCYCSYSLLMTNHLGEQLAEMLDKAVSK